MKKLLFPLCLALILASCGPTNQKQTKEASEEFGTSIEVPDISLKYDINPLLNKSIKEVEKILGKADSKTKITGYPCKYSKCTKAIFKNGLYEVIFKNGKTSRIVINSFPDYTYTQNAIQSIGLPKSEPSVFNSGTTTRWENIEGFYEIAFFTDYVLIMVDAPEG